MVPNRWHGIIWTNADPIHWCIYAELGMDELSNGHHFALDQEEYSSNRPMIWWFQFIRNSNINFNTWSTREIPCFRVPTDKPRKISMIFQWCFKTKIPNFHDNSESHKTEKHRTTCHAWSPHISYDHHWVFFFQKICKVSLLDLMTNISVNNVYVKYIFIYPCSQSKLCISEFNDFSMSNWSKIQWFF